MVFDKVKAIILLLVLVVPVIAIAATTATTTMTWFVPSNKSFSVSYASTCSATAFYFVESSCSVDSDVDGNAAKCAPYPDSGAAGTVCQNSSTAPITITNNGNTAINVDGNFLNAFSGADVNLVLKAWMGTGAGCGTNGMGGWAQDCTVTGTTTPVTSTTCRNYNQFNETGAGRLTSSLGIGDTNQLCFSGDFNVNVSQGSHAQDFNFTAT